jgi:dipeptidyl aminopeptidase/acylaminoacyl peptidase
MPIIAPYGSWKSPIVSDLVSQAALQLSQIKLDGDDTFWVEQRPSEGGRNVVVRRTRDGKIGDVTPPPFNARTRVHEYGGGAYAVDLGTIYFSNFDDQRLYRQDPGSPPRPLTPAVDKRFADGEIDRKRKRLICVREDHTVRGQAVNTIVGVNLDRDDAGGSVLVSGNNFYSNPRLSPDGTRLAWLTWNHPNMPWDGCELWIGDVNQDGKLGKSERVAGGLTESIFQPEWAPDGVLYFASDRTGWWNLYRRREGVVQPVCEKAAEFGVPQWVFGLSTYAFESAQRIVCVYSQRGSHLATIDTSTRQLTEIQSPFSTINNLRASTDRAVFLAGSPTQPQSIVQYDFKSKKIEVLRRSTELKIDPGYLSAPQAIEFPTEGGLTAHAYYYPPKNRDYTAPASDKPPLVVKVHGGPTGSTPTTFRVDLQYWTSRGFAVVDVDYGGSAGYGRPYRERLNGKWGVVDVDDSANAARYLVKQGWADANRVAISGGSAGGYTTLCAITFRDVFKAGASLFGISDLETFAKDTHKFESRYLDGLVGPLPQKRDLYRQRSAINYVDRIACPVILFQGLEDQVVPPSQSELIFKAVKQKGLPCAYVTFEGEQHGFRRAENIKRAFDGELYFYGKVFGFELAEPVKPVRIENLTASAKPKAASGKRQAKTRRGAQARKAAASKRKATAAKRNRK